jgi:hypothetical protein
LVDTLIVKRQTKNPNISAEVFVGLPGFEPRQTESKSVVLPLHHNPIFLTSFVFGSAKIGVLQKNPKQIVNVFQAIFKLLNIPIDFYSYYTFIRNIIITFQLFIILLFFQRLNQI